MHRDGGTCQKRAAAPGTALAGGSIAKSGRWGAKLRRRRKLTGRGVGGMIKTGWTGGRAAEGTGLLNQFDAGTPIAGKPHGVGDSAPDAESRPEPLAPVLAHDPELAEVAELWAQLDDPVRAAILHLVRAKSARR